MAYIDGVIVPVPTKNHDAYIALAQRMAAIFKDHGAIEVVECWGDDVPAGEVTSFPMAVKLQEDETAVFSWVRWPSKQLRDEQLPKVMEAMQNASAAGEMPFDGKRLIYGGFKIIVEA